MKKYAYVLTAIGAAASIAACGGGSDEGSGSGSGAGAGSGTVETTSTPNTAPLEVACLAMPGPDQQMAATVNVGPVTEVVTLTLNPIGSTTFDGDSLTTFAVKINGSLMNTRSKDLRFSPTYGTLFPVAVTEYGHPGLAGSTNTKYRKFTYRDSVTGADANLNLVGMKPNETRAITMNEYQASAVSTAAQPAFSSTPSRAVRLTIQYMGREDVSAMGKAYADACKLKVTYEREASPWFPKLESTIWLSRGFGPVKLTGAPLVGVETISAETSGYTSAFRTN